MNKKKINIKYELINNNEFDTISFVMYIFLFV